jgi:hypothetical protein
MQVHARPGGKSKARAKFIERIVKGLSQRMAEVHEIK